MFGPLRSLPRPALGALAAAALLGSVFRPGIFMTDSLVRWQTAFYLCGLTDIADTSRWFPPAMALAMGQFCRFDTHVWAFTLAQCAFFYVSLLLFLRALRPAATWRFAMSVGAVPTIALYSVFVTPDTWTAAALLLMLGALFQLGECAGRARVDEANAPNASDASTTPSAPNASNIPSAPNASTTPSARNASNALRGSNDAMFIWLASFALGCTVAFAVRANTIVIAPALITALFVLRIARRVRLCVVGIVLAATLLGGAVNRDARFHGDPALGALGAWAWEYAGTLRVLRDWGREIPVALRLEDLGMSTEGAIAQQEWATVDPILWQSAAAMAEPKLVADFEGFRARYMALIKAEPRAWLAAKARLSVCLLGLCPNFYEPTPWDMGRARIEHFRIAGWGERFIDPHGVGAAVLRAHLWVAQAVPGVFRPYVWLLVATLCLGLLRRWARGGAASVCGPAVVVGAHDAGLYRRAFCTWLLAVNYYAGFFVFCSAASFRYFFPSFVLFCALTACAVSEWLAQRKAHTA